MLGELRRAAAVIDRASCPPARPSVPRCACQFGQISTRVRRFCVYCAESWFRARLTLDPQRGWIQRERKILEDGRILACWISEATWCVPAPSAETVTAASTAELAATSAARTGPLEALAYTTRLVVQKPFVINPRIPSEPFAGW